jgi:hypothetical protein
MKKENECSCERTVPLSNAELADRFMRLQVIITKDVLENFVTIRSRLDDIEDRLDYIERKMEDNDY